MDLSYIDRPSSNGTQFLFQVTKTIINQTSAVVEHLSLAWQCTDELVSTNEHVPSTILTDSLHGMDCQITL